MIWNNVAERANFTYPVKCREKEIGFAIMQSRSITHWKRNGVILVMTGGDGMNDSILFI